ncbi:CotY/CotZ family spore coat protein [Ornithinibacillus sp. 179-J 7C1 HS]|uniref:CotY/CotZ family spore coat protein n=1 Tax=Ornithinibacillus sp. 179-J 7C1 HS TaxID=3142384 RepID=UPI0039A1BF23
MSCCHGKQSGECVCDVVSKIVKAQDEVAAAQDNCCTTGCENSIEQLLSPTTVNGNGPTTIPFVLYCKGDCDLFFATGLVQENTSLECIETPVFKAKKIKKGCCAELELLEFDTDNGIGLHHHSSKDKCNFIPQDATGNFIETGVCITVDLHCFCAIQCLNPVTPLPAPVVSPIGKDC